MSVSIQRPSGINVGVHNPGKAVYLAGSMEEGSLRLSVDSQMGNPIIEKFTSGLWQPTSIMAGSQSIWIGRNLALSVAGNHLLTKDAYGRLNLYPQCGFQDGISHSDTTALHAYSYFERLVVQPDNSGSFTGTLFGYIFTSVGCILSKKVYYQTDVTAATQPVRVCIFEGSDNTGCVIFDQTYPASQFVASTEISVELNGYVDYLDGATYFIQYESDADFSLKLDTTNTSPWFAADISFIREESLLQTKPWISGDDWDANDYFIKDRKIYICNTTGEQTGTFESNSALWDDIGMSSVAVSDRIESAAGDDLVITDTSLKYNDGIINRLVIDASEAKIQSPDGDNRFRTNNSNSAIVIGGSLRLVIGSSTSYLRSSDYDRGLWVKQASVALRANGKDRVWVDNLNTILYSPNLTSQVKVTNSNIELNQGGNLRIKVDANYTNIYSPDGGNLNIGNAGVFYSGAIVQMSTHKGAVNGIAELNASGIVPTSQLPSYVDAIDEYASLVALQTVDPQEANKVYVTTDDNKVYRYTGTPGSYVEISPTLVLGTTNATAYRGDRGLIAYDHSQTPHDYEAADEDIVKAPLGVLPVLDGSNLTGLGAGDVQQLISPNEDRTLELSDTNLLYQDGLYTRFLIDAAESSLRSPNGQEKVYISDGAFTYNDGTRNRLEVNASGSMLVSPDGSETLIVGNDGLLYNMVEIVTVNDISPNWNTAYSWGDHAGLYSLLSHTHSSILSPDTIKDLIINDVDLRYNDGAVDRLWINSALTGLISPNGQHSIVVSNTGATYDTIEISTIDHTHAESGSDKIISPDTLSTLTITNTSLIHTNSLGESRLEIDATQTRLRGVGVTPIYMKFGASSFEINDGVDRFMSNSSKSVMASPNDTWWSACYNDRYEVMDDTLARMFISSIASSMVSPDGQKNITIDNTAVYVNGVFNVNDGTRTRILADAGSSRMLSQDGGSYMSVGDGGIYLNHNVSPRLSISTTNTLMYSPDMSKFMKQDNDGMAIVGDVDITGKISVVIPVGGVGITAVGVGTNASVGLRIKQGAADTATIIDFYEEGSTRKAWIGFGSSSNRHGLFIFNDYVDGDVRITANNYERFILDGNNTTLYNFNRARWIQLTSALNRTSHAWSVGSDRNLKQNIEYLNNEAISFINKLKPVTFEHKDSPGKKSMGFIAQEVEEIQISDIVSTVEDGTKSLAYTEIIAPLVAYVQELQRQITDIHN